VDQSGVLRIKVKKVTFPSGSFRVGVGEVGVLGDSVDGEETDVAEGEPVGVTIGAKTDFVLFSFNRKIKL
jgi:hypothetical protein